MGNSSSDSLARHVTFRSRDYNAVEEIRCGHVHVNTLRYVRSSASLDFDFR